MPESLVLMTAIAPGSRKPWRRRAGRLVRCAPFGTVRLAQAEVDERKTGRSSRSTAKQPADTIAAMRVAAAL